VYKAFRAAGAVGVPVGVGIGLAAPTLLAHGSPALKARLLRRIVTGEDMWCQLFSEPGSGSDLAGLTTRADRDGDEWIVSGQKVWNSAAHRAAYGMLLARTDWEVPKHQGIVLRCLDSPHDHPPLR
jgi:alkylation response protein AidB-like acyl-CoA dehydrogenase